MAVDVDALRDLLARGCTRQQCADALGVGFWAVRGAMAKHGLRSTANDVRCQSVYRAPQQRGTAEGPRSGASLPGAACAPRSFQACPTMPAPPPVPDAADEAQNAARAMWVGNPRRDPKPHETHAPDGYHLRGVSTLLNAEGKPVMQWVKNAKDPEALRVDAIRKAIAELPETWASFHVTKPPPPDRDSDLLAVYTIADAHIGMFSWAEETGNDYDVSIAERLHVGAIRNLVHRAPPAEEAIVANLGDIVHCDSNDARTPRGGNKLDTDTRLHKVARVAMSVFHEAVDACLEKHKSVRIINCAGNHDPGSAAWMSVHAERVYANDPRVTVDGAADVYHWHRFGSCMLGFTHGTGPKPADLLPIMARLKPEDFGATKCRRWMTGHVHHQRTFEFPGGKVHSFGTLAPSDAWAHGEGYMSERDMRVSIYHRTLGERGQLVANVAELEMVA